MNSLLSVQDLIDDQLRKMELERSKDYKQTSWHPSSLGTCLTGAYLKRTGIKPEFDARLLRVFSIGNMMEKWVSERLRDTGHTVEEQIRIELPEWNMTGYQDFEVDGIPIELKSKHSRAFWYMNKQKEGANHHHKMQLWTYLKARQKNRGMIVYLSKDDLSVLEYEVLLNDAEIEEAVTKEMEILNRAWKEQLPPPPVTDSKAWQYKYCSLHKEHCLRQPEYLTTND